MEQWYIATCRRDLHYLLSAVKNTRGESRTESARLLSIAATKLQEAGWALREAEEEFIKEESNVSELQP